MTPRQLMNLGEPVGSGCVATIWAEEKQECEKRDEVSLGMVSSWKWMILREQGPDGEDEDAKWGLESVLH